MANKASDFIPNSKVLHIDTGVLNLEDACIVLVKTEWNAAIVDELEKGCVAELEKHHVRKIIVLTVPGAVEIPFAVKSYWQQTAKKNKADAFITLGCVIKGDTPHFDYVCNTVTDGVLELNLCLSVPVIFGVLTVNTEEQAKERIGGSHGHKGTEAAITALKMIALNRSFKKIVEYFSSDMNVQIFIPCFVDQLYPETAFNMVKVLEKAGCTVSYNTSQTCCGQPAFNAGFWDESKSICAKFLKDFKGADYIVAPSASCVGFVRNYYSKLFENSSLHHEVTDIGKRIFEFSEFMIDILKVENVGAELNGKATYHDSCAGLRECKIKKEPRQLLSQVKGLEISEMNDVETCCGFGGTFAVKFESISIGMGEQKVENALATGAQYLISTDLSCLMHLDGYIKHKGYSLKAMHLADVLANGW